MATAPVELLESPKKVRISKIGGRYLLFDIKDVAFLRRNHGMCSVFVGVTPQAPNQNLFSGLPMELAEAEAKLLVDQQVAYVEDDLAAHVSRLTLNPAARKAYVESLKRQRQQVLAAAELEIEQRRKYGEAKRAKQSGKPSKRRIKSNTDSASESSELVVPANDQPEAKEDALFDMSIEKLGTDSVSAQPKTYNPPFTPNTSAGLLEPGDTDPDEPGAPSAAPLQAHLNSNGYYLTPGLRFGCDYSAYPGDPFRYHAHFMARSYGWDEEINMLDLVGGGRLATAVKKGFLMGAEKPNESSGAEVGSVEKTAAGDNVRCFSLEWAAI